MPSSLRGKTRFIIFVTMVCLVGGLYALSRVVLLRGFSHLENDSARQNLDRASSALANELASLDRTTSEYATWDQTYAYFHGTNPGYIKSEYAASTFQQLNLNFVILFDNSGKKVFAKGVDPQTGLVVPIPDDLDKHLKVDSLLFSHRNTTSGMSGILMLQGGPILIDARPVLTSDSKGPIAGTLMFGRTLDAAAVQRLSQTTHLEVELLRIDQESTRDDLRWFSDAASRGASVAIRPAGSDSIAGYQELTDIYGQPALLLRVVLPRSIYDQGHTSLLQFLLLLLAAVLVFGSMTMYLLERMVLSRVAN
ncbi:MAG: CHASE4 domain-containing protein, partial [Blastocatellia bacterium]